MRSLFSRPFQRSAETLKASARHSSLGPFAQVRSRIGFVKALSGASLATSLLGVTACSSNLGGPESNCPPTTPTDGASCAVDSLARCAYGGDAYGQCRTYATCGRSSLSAASTWTVTEPAAGCGVNALTCAATFGADEGNACTDFVDTCEYSEGLCGCVPCNNGSSIVGQTHCRRFDDIAAGCPTVPPVPGQRCSSEGLDCGYGQCCRGPNFGPPMRCEGGTWQPILDPACMCAIPRCTPRG